MLANLVKGILADISIVLSQCIPSAVPDVPLSDWADLFRSLTQISEQLVKYNDRHVATIKEAIGPHVVDESFEAIAPKFSA